MSQLAQALLWVAVLDELSENKPLRKVLGSVFRVQCRLDKRIKCRCPMCMFRAALTLLAVLPAEEPR